MRSEFHVIQDINQPELIRISKSKKDLRLHVRVFTFNDGKHEIGLIPSLSLSSYGNDRESMVLMLQETLDDYLDKLLELKIELIEADLSAHGWKKQQFHSKNFDGPYIDKAGILREFELPENTVMEEQMITA